MTEADLRRAFLWCTTADGADLLDWLRQRAYVTRTTVPAMVNVKGELIRDSIDPYTVLYREGRRSLVLDLEQAIDRAKTEGPAATTKRATTALSGEA